MKHFPVRLTITIVVGSLLSGPAVWAQSTAQINGTVRDQTGAVVPNVEVTATQTDTGVRRNATTDASGSYTLPSLPVGRYRLEAGAKGFRTYVQTGIVLQVDDNSVINPVLDIGQISDQVQVEAAVAQVETRNTGISEVMDSTRVVELPLNGRQVTDLIVLSGAATVSATTGFVRNYPTVNISVAGGMHNGLTYLLDGASHNDPINGLNLALPFPDALQEFKLETSSLLAQYGQHSAGTVNAITKSGTNDFHGDVFEFLRNGDLNARNIFATSHDTLKRNQFGGTVGGRIIKNKLFFFAGYQGTRIRATPVPQFATLPTAAMLAGDWTTITSPQCNGGRQIMLKAPFVNNRISSSQYSPVAVAIMNSGQFPNATNPCGQVAFGIKPSTNENFTLVKIDYQITEKHSFFGRYELAHLVDPPAYTPGNLLTTGQATNGPYTTYPVINDWQTQSLVLGDTYLISTSMVSSFRAALLRPTNFRGNPPKELAPESVGIQGIYEPVANRILGLSVSGGFSIGGQGGNVPGLTNATGLQFSEDLSWVKGAHQLGFGVNYIHSILNASAYTSAAGVFAFTAANTGLGLGDFMLGDVNTYTQAGVARYEFGGNYIGTYVQDTWKLNPRFTVNVGLRWDPFLPMYWRDGQDFHYEQQWFDQGVHSTVYPNAPVGVLYSGDQGVPNSGKNEPNQWWHFSPRLGLAWDPKGDSRMTIRASYGLFRDYADLYQSENVRSSPPWNGALVIQSPSFSNPWLGYPGGNPFPVTVDKNTTFPTAAQWLNVPLNLPSVYVHQWNFSVQKQIGTWLLTANYIGNQVIHLLNTIEINPAVYLPGGSCVINGKTYTPCSSVANTQQRRVLSLENPGQGQYYSDLIQEDASGTLSYNGVLLTAQHRLSNGLTVQANYTWSHCINTGTNQIFAAGGSDAPYTEARLRANRGNCAGLEVDRRHNFNLSTVYATPRFSNSFARLLGTGWQVSGIVKILSGSYFSISSGIDSALSGIALDERPNQVLAKPYSSSKSIGLYLNPAAFAQAATGVYGNMGPNTIQGPRFFGIDLGLVRKFPIRERQALELRGEGFNMLNHTNPNNPVATLTSTTFGQIQSASDPRILQLALKFMF